MASGLSPADRSPSGDASNARGASKIPLVDAHDTGAGDPCLRTIVSPISPTGQCILLRRVNNAE
jgi:hypothetical protein